MVEAGARAFASSGYETRDGIQFYYVADAGNEGGRASPREAASSGGDYAVAVVDAHLHERGCPLADRFDTITEGTTGQVVDTCTTDGGEERVLFSPDGTFLPAGWVNGLALEPC